MKCIYLIISLPNPDYTLPENVRREYKRQQLILVYIGNLWEMQVIILCIHVSVLLINFNKQFVVLFAFLCHQPLLCKPIKSKLLESRWLEYQERIGMGDYRCASLRFLRSGYKQWLLQASHIDNEQCFFGAT